MQIALISNKVKYWLLWTLAHSTVVGKNQVCDPSKNNKCKLDCASNPLLKYKAANTLYLLSFLCLFVSCRGKQLRCLQDAQCSYLAQCAGEFPDLGGPQGEPRDLSGTHSSWHSRWQDMDGARAKFLHIYKRSPWGVWVTRMGKQGMVPQQGHWATVC